jgi:hypothetical protein
MNKSDMTVIPAQPGYFAAQPVNIRCENDVLDQAVEWCPILASIVENMTVQTWPLL